MKNWNFALGVMCAAWLVALYYVANPQSVWDWRVFAAFAQAILSAGAIYSAYWLQSKKREADRRQDEVDEVFTLEHYSFVFEDSFRRLVGAVRAGMVRGKDLALQTDNLKRALASLEKVNPSLMPTGQARLALRDLQQAYGSAVALMEVIAAGGGTHRLKKGYFNSVYVKCYADRSSLLEALSLSPEPARQLRPRVAGKAARAVSMMRRTHPTD